MGLQYLANAYDLSRSISVGSKLARRLAEISSAQALGEGPDGLRIAGLSTEQLAYGAALRLPAEHANGAPGCGLGDFYACLVALPMQSLDISAPGELRLAQIPQMSRVLDAAIELAVMSSAHSLGPRVRPTSLCPQVCGHPIALTAWIEAGGQGQQSLCGE
jgi:hypothetical protein